MSNVLISNLNFLEHFHSSFNLFLTQNFYNEKDFILRDAILFSVYFLTDKICHINV